MTLCEVITCGHAHMRVHIFTPRNAKYCGIKEREKKREGVCHERQSRVPRNMINNWTLFLIFFLHFFFIHSRELLANKAGATLEDELQSMFPQVLPHSLVPPYTLERFNLI